MLKSTKLKGYSVFKFTLVELLIVVSIISILASILLPALNKARNKALEISCLNNLKSSGQMLSFYLSDYDNTFPKYSSFFYRIEILYVYKDGNSRNNAYAEDSSRLFSRCPKRLQSNEEYSAYKTDWYSYGVNYMFFPGLDSAIYNIPTAKVLNIKSPSHKAYMTENNAENGYYSVNPYAAAPDYNPFPRHNPKVGVLWIDSHVSFKMKNGFYGQYATYNEIKTYFDPRY